MWNTPLPQQQNLIESNSHSRWWENSAPSQFNPHYADRYTLNKHVIQLFQGYAERELQDWWLYKVIRADFRQFREEHFNELDYSTWMYVREYCYTHGFWLKETSATGMLQAINSNFYEDWFMEQIRWVEKRYNRLSDKMMKRKLHLIIFAQQQQSNQSVSAIASVIAPAVVPASESAVASAIEPAVASVSQSTVASAIQSSVAPASQSSVASTIQSAVASVIQPAQDQSPQPSLAISVNQPSQQAPSIIQNAAPVSIKQATSSPIQQAPQQAPEQAPDQAPPQAAPQAPDQATPEKAAPPINQNVALIPSQNVAPTLTIQNAASEQATPLISQKLAPIFSQNAILIADLFKKKVFQSISQHLIVCLATTISTLPARGIG
jgi:hypothetical protein